MSIRLPCIKRLFHILSCHSYWPVQRPPRSYFQDCLTYLKKKKKKSNFVDHPLPHLTCILLQLFKSPPQAFSGLKSFLFNLYKARIFFCSKKCKYVVVSKMLSATITFSFLAPRADMKMMKAGRSAGRLEEAKAGTQQ